MKKNHKLKNLTREPVMGVYAKIRPGINPKVAVAKKLGELGMIAMAENPGNVFTMTPPLIVTKDEIDEGDLMDQALEVADKYAEARFGPFLPMLDKNVSSNCNPQVPVWLHG